MAESALCWDASRLRVRDLPRPLPLREDSLFDGLMEEDLVRLALCDFKDTSIDIGAVVMGLELVLLGDLALDLEDEDSEDDEIGFESSLDPKGLFGAFGGRFLCAITGLSLLRFKRCFAGGLTGAHEASELIGFFIQVATVVVSVSSYLLLFSPNSIWSRLSFGQSKDSSPASNPAAFTSSLNATHSSFVLFNTIFVEDCQ
mmetsp:Transcript_8134/g.17530  ORF Transcript_8134/g.17530 Transcript_8134/m.17530 type:complete len:201 (-) Transcript_8134:236-838(-)